MAPFGTMKHPSDATKFSTIKVPTDFAERLRTRVRENGMTIAGAFRTHGSKFIDLLPMEKPRRKTAAAS